MLLGTVQAFAIPCLSICPCLQIDCNSLTDQVVIFGEYLSDSIHNTYGRARADHLPRACCAVSGRPLCPWLLDCPRCWQGPWQRYAVAARGLSACFAARDLVSMKPCPRHASKAAGHNSVELIAHRRRRWCWRQAGPCQNVAKVAARRCTPTRSNRREGESSKEGTHQFVQYFYVP